MRTPTVGSTPISPATLSSTSSSFELLQHDHHRVAQLLADQGEAHELLVLVAVADDQVAGALVEAQHRHQLGLGAALEPDAVRRAELDDLLHHVALLIDLDRIDRGVGALVAELLDRRCEALRQLGDARLEDVGKAQQERQADALGAEIHRDVVEIDAAPGDAVGMHGDVPSSLIRK